VSLTVAAGVLLLPLVALFVHRLGEVPPSRPTASRVEPSLSRLEAQVEVSRALLQKNDGRGALALLLPLNAENPDNPSVLNNLCVAYGILGKRQEAVSACTRCLAIDANHQLAKANLNWVRQLPETSAP
jgi:predicted Zn-dependent protease